ncbi:MAG: VWA domain-containing protein, partial [Myxococcota bacterium]
TPGGGVGTGTLTEAVLSAGFELQDRLEAAAEQVRLHEIRHSMQIGFFTQRMLEALGAEGIDGELDGLQRRLEADGVDGELIEAVRREAARLRPRVRAFVNDALERADPRRRERFRHERLVATPFVRLDRQEMAEVEEVVRRLGERLRGRLAIRRKRARRGGIDARATLRASYATLGVPVRILRRRRTIERPRLVLLVDVSESVRAVSRFFLQLVYALQEAFSGTRTFVFVGDVGEATALFRKHRVDDAIGRVLDGEAVLLASHSDYGTVFERFFRHHLSALTARSELLVLGDARSNRLDPRLDAFRGLTERAARTLWFNPEPRSSWGFGDSEMARFRPFVDEAFSVADVAALEKAVDALVRSRARSR